MCGTDNTPVACHTRGVVKPIRWPLTADVWRLPLLGPSGLDIKYDVIEVLSCVLLGLAADRDDPQRPLQSKIER